jgi:UDP-N-acetylmuramoylalanine--D-glutamate ligase
LRYSKKKIAVLGMGDSGVSAALRAGEEGAMLAVLDTGDARKLKDRIQRLRDAGINSIVGPEAAMIEDPFDLAILSPGIDPAAPLVQNFIRRRIDVIGELEFAYELCECPVIAITGTNGKTTTTGLVAAMLNGCGVKTIAAGNIGPAFSAEVRNSRDLDVVTLEVSSFQLERIRTFHPKISAWLNFAPDHLDRYPNAKAYAAAKFRIFENQTADDFAVVNLRDQLPPLAPKTITFSAYADGGDFSWKDGVILFHKQPVLRLEDTRLRGLHNAENLMASLGIGHAWGLEFEKMIGPLCEYSPLAHRCELIRTIGSVEWVNDSKATNLDAMEKALISETRPIILIAGGKDKGFDFDNVKPLLPTRVKTAVLIGEMKDRIEASWRDLVPCRKAETLEEAVKISREQASPGNVVLFSPGTSSFDMFKNYGERGNRFRDLVNAIEDQP